MFRPVLPLPVAHWESRQLLGQRRGPAAVHVTSPPSSFVEAAGGPAEEVAAPHLAVGLDAGLRPDGGPRGEPVEAGCGVTPDCGRAAAPSLLVLGWASHKDDVRTQSGLGSSGHGISQG